MDELLLFTSMSPPLHFRQTGSSPQFSLTSSPPNIDGRALTIYIDEPLLHFKQTGSSLQFLLTSSPLNTDGQALTIYVDEPFTALQTDGLLPTILIDELSSQHRRASSYYLRLTSPLLHFKQTGSSPQFSLTSSPPNTDGRALTIYIDEPLLHFKQTGFFLQFLLMSPPLHFKQTGSFLIDEFSPQYRRTSSHYLR